MATLKDIADEVGISIAAASLALRDHRTISVETKERVWKAQEKFGYKLHLRQNSRRGRKEVKGVESYDIAFLLIDRQFSNPLYGMSFERIAGAAARRHWRPVYISTTLAELHAGHLPPLLEGGDFDGIIVSGVYDRMAHRQVQKLGLPIVVRGTYNLGSEPWNSCEPDIGFGLRLMVERLMALGHTRFGLILREVKGEFGYQAHQAFLREMDCCGLESVGVAFEAEQPRGAYHAAESLLKAGATAIILGSDVFGSEVYEACADAGLKIPEDVSIISYQSGVPTDLKPTLVLVGAAAQEHDFSTRLVDRLGQMIADHSIPPVRELYPMEMTPGGSIGKAPKRRRPVSGE